VTTIDLGDFDPYRHDVQQDPFPYYRCMRETSPAWRLPGSELWFVTRHDLVAAMLRDTATYSSAFGTTPNEPPKAHLVEQLDAIKRQGPERLPTMLTVDPPDHTRYRATVARAFNARSIAALRPLVEAIVDEELDRVIGAGTVDFRTAFARPVPVRVIIAALGLDPARQDDIGRWSDDSTASIGSMLSDERTVEAQWGILEFQRYMVAELTDRQRAIRDDVVSMLVAADLPLPDGTTRPMVMGELIGILQQLIGAGNETTTKLLSEIVRLLDANPIEWQRLRADPSRAAIVVEEALRLATPTQAMYRRVTRDVDIEGVHVPEGARVVLVYAAANRDPAVFPDPDRFDPDRVNVREHLAFGAGVHFCIGAPLSRLETTIAVEQIARQVGAIRLAPENTFEYEPSYMLRGLHRLLVELDPVA
jgi:cytochrome P450